MGDLSKHFSIHEFSCRCGCNTPFAVDMVFIGRLEKLREAIGGPIRIASGFRCAKRNEEVGGKPDSAHTRPFLQAADLVVTGSRERYVLVREALRLDFPRIGLYTESTCLHLDLDPTLPQNVLWIT